AKGGIALTTGSWFSSKDDTDQAYGFGASAEYFFLRGLSGGLEMVHTSFPGERKKSGYYDWYDTYASTGWNWTKVGVFGRIVAGPERKFSPFLKVGVGLYEPRVEDWLYYPGGEDAPPGWPLHDVTFTRNTYGKGQFGYGFGFGLHYLATPRMLLYLEIPFDVVSAKGLVIEWVDDQTGVGQRHEIYGNRYHLSLFAGVSFLLGPEKKAEKAGLIP
ncbi:MAG: hypothetical protein WBC98_13170, partial [Candidatus Zixiibacteriota bacterium]